ncbi:hypothetical protein [Reinekea marinisedimentorum]|uniref:Uncharacterized protein n=1 Tax=Reinekea marinisedimentorum TaxID=230495 RepID=A0A4R3I2C9_9GAMM|nr:hypothetical protein [Reinekea marinisedimentorum]TCS39732.1 hypothetical protein BCF53_11217 [Reinekea marinisedimentorum]
MTQAQAINTENLTPAAIEEFTALLNEKGANDSTLAEMKTQWPQFRFILCSEDDMGGKDPYWENDDYQLHLIAASLGCASLSRSPESSVGVIIATIEPDDD